MKIRTNSELRTSNTELWSIAPNWIVIHLGPDLSIWISLLHPYVSYCFIVLVVLTLAYVPLLLYPSPYCLALVPFRMYSEQQNCSHVWKFWIVHLIEGKIKCEKLYKYLPIFPIIPPIWQTKNLGNQLVASWDTIILWPRSHLNSFVADESTAENCILPVFSIAAFGF